MGHHSKGNVSGRRVIGTPDLVNLIRFGHDHAVPLHNHCVGVNASLHSITLFIQNAHFFRENALPLTACYNLVHPSLDPNGKSRY